MPSPDYTLPGQNEFERAITLAQVASDVWSLRSDSASSLSEFCDRIQATARLNPLNLSARQLRRVYFDDERVLVDFIVAARRL